MTATANSSTSIFVTWMEVLPTDQNGVITNYEVIYTPLETFVGQIGRKSAIVSGFVFSSYLMHLQEFVNYSITVRTYTVIGSGPNSSNIIEHTLEAGMVLFITGNTYPKF